MKATTKLTIENSFYISQRMLDSLQILQMDSLSLEKHISEQLMENPVLEFPVMHGKSSERTTLESLQLSNSGDYDTLDFFLLDQLGRMKIPKRTMGLCKALVRLIDENGYLQVSLIPDVYLRNQEYPRALEALQTLEPAGVGARDLKECLLLQVRRISPENVLAVELIKNHLEDISRRNHAKLLRNTGASMEELQDAIRLILSLNPRPGASFGNREKTAYIHPDFIISVRENKIEIVQEERSFPVLTISDYYSKLFHTTTDPEVRRYLKERVTAAKHLITGLENRKTTTLRCMEAIIQVQQSFFLNPSRQLMPLTLGKAAQMLNLHISTVSRAVNEKYLEFEGKTYPLKYFFVRGIQDENAQISTSQIRELIRQIICNENPEAPMSDQQIVQVLQQGGCEVSRRTVAKYREQMGILSSKQRRMI